MPADLERAEADPMQPLTLIVKTASSMNPAATPTASAAPMRWVSPGGCGVCSVDPDPSDRFSNRLACPLRRPP